MQTKQTMGAVTVYLLVTVFDVKTWL